MTEVAPKIINSFPNACSKESSFAFSRLWQGEEDLRLFKFAIIFPSEKNTLEGKRHLREE